MDLPEPPAPPARNPAPGLRLAAWLAAVTAVAAGCAAAAEVWRFVLLLQGRTEVLSGTTVRASDVLVAATGLAVVGSALATAAVAVPAMVRAHSEAARRLGRTPSRSEAAVAARLLVPVWNIYGAGQIAVEVDRMLTKGRARDEPAAPFGVPSSRLTTSRVPTSRLTTPRLTTSRLTTLWWCGWILSAVLVLVTLARGWGGSLQAIADTVELHIAVDLAAVLVGVLTFLVLRRFAMLFDGPRSPLTGWVVQPPAPTRPVPLERPAAQLAAQPATEHRRG